jgi:hypothetical protein
MRLAGHVARTKQESNGHSILVTKPEGKHRHVWDDNIKRSFIGTGCGALDCFNPAQDWDKWNTVMKLRVP